MNPKKIAKSLLQRFGIWKPQPMLTVFTRDFPRYNQFDIGEWTYGTPRIWAWGEGATLRIGRYCSIAADVQIFLGGEHRTDWVTTFPFNVLWDEAKQIEGHPSTRGDVVIANDVWIGTGATILSGVTVGDGAVIGAGSVVAKNVAPYTVVAGNPARQIRLRFDESQIRELLQIAWWEWPREKVVEAIPHLLSNDISSFIEHYRSWRQLGADGSHSSEKRSESCTNAQTLNS